MYDLNFFLFYSDSFLIFNLFRSYSFYVNVHHGLNLKVNDFLSQFVFKNFKKHILCSYRVSFPLGVFVVVSSIKCGKMRLDGQRQTLVTLYLIILIIYCWLPGQSLILYVLPKIHVNEHLGGHMYSV